VIFQLSERSNRGAFRQPLRLRLRLRLRLWLRLPLRLPLPLPLPLPLLLLLLPHLGSSNDLSLRSTPFCIGVRYRRRRCALRCYKTTAY
jgi:hypothetical protein